MLEVEIKLVDYIKKSCICLGIGRIETSTRDFKRAEVYEDKHNNLYIIEDPSIFRIASSQVISCRFSIDTTIRNDVFT